MLEIYKKIENYSDNERERLKYALTLSQNGIVLCPVSCIISGINYKHYYKLFKAIDGRKTRLIRELENNFIDMNLG